LSTCGFGRNSCLLDKNLPDLESGIVIFSFFITYTLINLTINSMHKGRKSGTCFDTQGSGFHKSLASAN